MSKQPVDQIQSKKDDNTTSSPLIQLPPDKLQEYHNLIKWQLDSAYTIRDYCINT